MEKGFSSALKINEWYRLNETVGAPTLFPHDFQLIKQIIINNKLFLKLIITSLLYSDRERQSCALNVFHFNSFFSLSPIAKLYIYISIVNKEFDVCFAANDTRIDGPNDKRLL